MKHWTAIMLSVGLVAALSFPLALADGDEEDVPLCEVPQVVKDAAANAVKGLVLTEAEKETENGVVIYELEGIADGVEYELEITADGTVLEVEKEDQDDEDEDNEDEDNEDEEDEDDS